MYQPKRHFYYPPSPPPPPPKKKKSYEHWFNTALLNFEFPEKLLGQVENRIHKSISKIHQPRLSDTTFFTSWNFLLKGMCSDYKTAQWASKSVSQQIKIFWAKWVNIFLSLKQGGNITRLINGGMLNWLFTACHILETILSKKFYFCSRRSSTK